MIKILILAAIVTLTTAIGKLLSSEKRKRAKVFEEMYEFNERLLLNMKYNRVPISVIADDYPYIKKLLEGDNPLCGEDGNFLDSYKCNLGITDAMSQIDYLNERKIAIKKYKEESADDCKKYSSLYMKIFFMVGVLIAVLLA